MVELLIEIESLNFLIGLFVGNDILKQNEDDFLDMEWFDLSGIVMESLQFINIISLENLGGYL